MQLVVFTLDKEEYGIDVSSVNGILRAKKFTIQAIPGRVKVLEGMINLRGEVNYIFNLRTKLGLEKSEPSEESKFIMLNDSRVLIGCIVDEVTDIIKVDEAEIMPTPYFIKDTKGITGIGKYEGRMIIILDPEKMLFTQELENIHNTISHERQ